MSRVNGTVYVMLANGFEEIEALATIDVLRRAELDVKIVGVSSPVLTGSHGISVHCDLLASEVDGEDIIAIVLPGGMPGTLNLEKSSDVQRLIDLAVEKGALVCAICAAPSILGHKGLLNGRKATCFVGFEDELEGAIISEDKVVVDGNFITAKAAGVTIPFALKIVGELGLPEIAQAIKDSMQCD